MISLFTLKKKKKQNIFTCYIYNKLRNYFSLVECNSKSRNIMTYFKQIFHMLQAVERISQNAMRKRKIQWKDILPKVETKRVIKVFLIWNIAFLKNFILVEYWSELWPDEWLNYICSSDKRFLLVSLCHSW